MEFKTEDMKDVIYKQIAAEVISKLDTPARDAILAKAVTAALESYNYKRAVEDAVCTEAAKIAVQLLSNEHYQHLIRTTIDASLETSIRRIAATIPEAMLRLFGGKDGSHTYDRGPGLLHSLLKEPKDA